MDLASPLAPYDFRDPGAVIRAIADRVPLVDGAAYLALVAHPATEQELVRVDRLRTPSEILEYDDACEELSEVIATWPLPDQRPPQHSTVLVLVRPGRCLFGVNEAQWYFAERYTNHFQPLWPGTTIVVTEHGWYDGTTQLGGREPAMLRTAA
jgi:hypothetical protein